MGTTSAVEGLQLPAHDLAGGGLGQIGHEPDRAGTACRRPGAAGSARWSRPRLRRRQGGTPRMRGPANCTALASLPSKFLRSGGLTALSFGIHSCRLDVQGRLLLGGTSWHVQKRLFRVVTAS
jgi:hypothetical protein